MSWKVSFVTWLTWKIYIFWKKEILQETRKNKTNLSVLMDRLGRASPVLSHFGCSQPLNRHACALVYDKVLTVSNAPLSPAITINRRIKQTQTCLGRDSGLQNYRTSFRITTLFRASLTPGNGRDAAKAGLVFHHRDCRGRGSMGVRVMEWQRAVTNTERWAEKGERREEKGMRYVR